MGLRKDKWVTDFEALSFNKRHEFYELFSELFSNNKRTLFEELINKRTYHITVVLENIYQSQNASAVLRTCDCFGVQDIHVIENEHNYQVNPDIALGASKWVDIHKYNTLENNTEVAYKTLKEQGYKIVATLPNKEDVLLQDLDITEKTALIFGTEKEGLSEYAIKHADAYVKIPMYGFTESLNISASAAICLFHLTEKMRNSSVNWQLTPEEKIVLKTNWARNVVRDSARVFDEAFKRFISDI